jgi:molybdopterin-guanine dinucleotide biosynthesis protein A
LKEIKLSVAQNVVPIQVPLAIAILAGGLSTRMGQDKSLVPLNGRPMLAHVIRRLELVRQSNANIPLFIISNDPSAYAQFGRPVFSDILPNRSSLNGLYSALWHSPGRYTLCVACDMPFLEPAVLSHLIDSVEGWQAVVPRIDGFIESLCAVYEKSCLEPFHSAIQAGTLKIHQVVAALRTRYVEADVLRQFDPHLRSFVNLNTPQDIEGIP